MDNYLLGILVCLYFEDNTENGMIVIPDNTLKNLYPKELFCYLNDKLFYAFSEIVIEIVNDKTKILKYIDKNFIKGFIKYSHDLDVDDELISYLYIHSKSNLILEIINDFLKREWNISSKIENNEIIFDSENTKKFFTNLL